MKRIDELVFSYSDLVTSMSRVAQTGDNLYARAYELAYSASQELINWPQNPDDPVNLYKGYNLEHTSTSIDDSMTTRLGDYFLSEIYMNVRPSSRLDPAEVQLRGRLMVKSWQSGFPVTDPCFDLHDTLSQLLCRPCSLYDHYYREANMILDELIELDRGRLSLYRSSQDTIETIQTDHYPGGWSNNDVIPIGLFIEKSVLVFLRNTKKHRLLRDIKGSIIIINR